MREVRAHSIVGADGVEREVDTIVFGTGFHVTDIPAAHRVRGRGGELLDDVWHGSPRAYLGTTVAGFPNLFLLLGPNTGLGHSSMVYMIESQIAHVMAALRTCTQRGAATIEVRREAQDALQRRGRRAGSRARSGTPAARAGTSTTRAATRRSGRTGRGASAAAPASCGRTTTPLMSWHPCRSR